LALQTAAHHRERQAAERARRHAQQADQDREPRLQPDHEPDARTAVREICPDETHHVGERGRAAHEGHGEIHEPRIRRGGERLLDEHRRRRAFDETQRETEQRPGRDLPPERGFRRKAHP
jgi:hypothetical protein